MATRKPFDATEAMGALYRDEAPPPLTVSELAARITGVVSAGFPGRVTVVGEVSRPTDRTHLYFRLKDESAVIEAICFRADLARLAVRPKEGDRVVATGRVNYWAEGGKLSLRVETMEPVGTGSLEERLRRLKVELTDLGWFDASLKRPLPLFPSRIAIITSRTGAALQDCLATARKRMPSVEVIVVDVHVQGAGAEREIAAAITAVDGAAGRLGIDAMVVTRGGGSLEDLWCFNERIVAQAIHEAAIPVVSAIGHEIDTTIADLVADHRAPTPTAAITALLPDREELREELDSLRSRAANGAQRLIAQRRESLRAAAERPALTDPATPLCAKRVLLGETGRLLSACAARATERASIACGAQGDRLLASLPSRLVERRALLAGVAGRLGAVNPRSVLERGYSMVARPDGRVVQRAEGIAAGESLRITWSDGARDVHVDAP